ncbi:hypothetical protein F2P81_009112 [Scophthalmus maximus]|uniref:Apoptosis-inducing factor 3-like n=1 Tax=Scophthalmus maximus TaxID=52904 RepID=A0A6A4T2R1_SCOMX|nr:hypothetical protein F2P81_009112 [Scophthalmus maximus]
MVSRDNLLPYDKARLSKVMNVESDSILLRRMEFYHQYDIEVWLRKEAMSVDTDKKTVTFDNGSVQSYDQLLVATGCRAKGLDMPGMELGNVKMLETPEDARQIHSACLGCNVVLVGTSFVGMEVASYLIDKASSITVIGSSELPYQNTLGPEIGKVTMMMLSEQGVRFYMNDMVAEVRGVNGKVKSDVTHRAQFVRSLKGIIPNSEVLRGSKIRMDAKSFVPVDKYMRTNVPDVFCGGDVATFPLAMAKDRQVNIGHWQMAQAHGRIAALNMLNKPTELNTVPFYWTVLLGYGEGYTEIVVKGRFEDRRFLALYIKDDEVIAVATLNFDPAASAVAERFAAGKVITKKEAVDDEVIAVATLNFDPAASAVAERFAAGKVITKKEAVRCERPFTWGGPAGKTQVTLTPTVVRVRGPWSVTLRGVEEAGALLRVFFLFFLLLPPVLGGCSSSHASCSGMPVHRADGSRRIRARAQSRDKRSDERTQDATRPTSTFRPRSGDDDSRTSHSSAALPDDACPWQQDTPRSRRGDGRRKRNSDP